MHLEQFFTEIPTSKLSHSSSPDEKVKKLTEAAALKAAMVSATLSAPGGVVGMLASLPDLAAIWRIQAQLVADIAATYGKLGYLTKQSLVWCLCKQSGVQIARDVAMRVGTHFLLKKSKLKLLSRALPVVSAISGGAYAAYDTYSVSKIAKAYFENSEFQNVEDDDVRYAQAESAENDENLNA